MSLKEILWCHLLGACFILTTFSQGSPMCNSHTDCGWNSYCQAGDCTCVVGFSRSRNGRDCVDNHCRDDRCLECASAEKCHRCVDFIEETTGKCRDDCPSYYILVVEGDHVGRVCSVHVQDMMTVYIAIIIGISCGMVVIALLAAALYWKMKKNKDKKFNISAVGAGIKNTEDKSKNKSNGNGQSYNNSGYGVNVPIVGASNFMKHLFLLRPHTQAYVCMLREARDRLQALDVGDARIQVYEQVIHHLCRVLSLLTTTSSHITPPADGMNLLAWAERILHSYLKPNPENISLEASSNTGTLTSTFKPDRHLISSTNAPSKHQDISANAFKYERYKFECEPSDSSQDSDTHSVPEFHFSTLKNDFTEPIEV